MTNTSHASSLWNLQGTTAKLHAPHATATIDLRRTYLGLYGLTVGDQTLAGSFLGLTLDEGQSDLPQTDIQDCFTRGGDLVVSYQQTEDRPFGVQIYWRIDDRFEHGLQVDAIISLQTSLLESFPQVATLSTQAISEAWHLTESGEPTCVASVGETKRPCSVTYDRATALLLRNQDAPWSYLEATHPSDLGTCQLQVDADNQATMRRVLGGEFQEKGVIRRMRVRGCLLPREGDLEAARQLMKEFASAAPPLTV